MLFLTFVLRHNRFNQSTVRYARDTPGQKCNEEWKEECNGCCIHQVQVLALKQHLFVVSLLLACLAIK